MRIWRLIAMVVLTSALLRVRDAPGLTPERVPGRWCGIGRILAEADRIGS